MSYSIANLTSVKGSKLEMLFKDYHRHGLLHMNSDGRVYIDRDPTIFARLLDYCSNNGKLIAQKDPFDRAMF